MATKPTREAPRTSNVIGCMINHGVKRRRVNDNKRQQKIR